MTRLEGEFAIMLIFSTPASLKPERLRKAFAPLESRLKLVVHLKPLSGSEGHAPRKQGETYRISVYGADRPGIVFRVSEMLARAGLNVTDVHTHRSTGGKSSLYLLLLEVEVPPRVKMASLEQRLKELGKRLGVEVSLHSAEADVL